jgi:signal transduction histidine kinase/ActR/RegA family two-component response regulator
VLFPSGLGKKPGEKIVPDRAFKGELRKGYFAPVIAMAVLAAVIVWRVDDQIQSVQWVEHTSAAIRETEDARQALLNMGIAIRSYWITGQKNYLDDFQSYSRELSQRLASASALASDNPTQGQRLLEASELKGTWIGSVQALMSQAPAQNRITNQLESLDAKLNSVSVILKQVVEEEDRLLKQRQEQQQSEDRLLLILVPLLSALGAAILAYWAVRHFENARRQFAGALAQAQEAARTRDNFLAVVSHELRNPLNTILLTTNLLSNEQFDDRVRRRIDAIARAAHSQAQLVEDLLDVSRIQSGRLRLDVQSTDLGKVMNAAVESMRVAAEAKQISLQEIIDTKVGQIAGDPKRLEQVVWNLVSNAIKFTPKGGKVQVRLERINSHIEIVVADSGQGIAESAIPYLFNRFWQGEPSGEGSLGLGLGLSIVKELVNLHGGSVIAHSDGIGKGSTFIVRLPVPAAAIPSLDLRRHPTIAGTDNVTQVPRLDGLLLLVVDDDADAREALSESLTSLGATVHVENSARGALNALTRLHPDAVVADIEMPIQDGFSLAKDVRAFEQQQKTARRTSLVALTAYGRVEDRVKILASGFHAHLVKPVDLAELSATIGSLVTARAA